MYHLPALSTRVAPESETRTINPGYGYPHKRPRLSEPSPEPESRTTPVPPVPGPSSSALPSPPLSRISRPPPEYTEAFNWESWITRRLDGTPASPSESYINRTSFLREFASRDNLRAGSVLVQDAEEGAKTRRAQAEEEMRCAQRKLTAADDELVLLARAKAWMEDELARPSTPKKEDVRPYTPTTPKSSAPSTSAPSKPKRCTHPDPNRPRVRSILAPNTQSFIDYGTPEDLCARYNALFLRGSYRKVTGLGRYRIWPPRRNEGPGGDSEDDLVFVTPENVYEVPPHLSCPHCRNPKRFRKIPGSNLDLKSLPRCLWLADSIRPCCLICHRSSSHKSGGTNMCGADFDAIVRFRAGMAPET